MDAFCIPGPLEFSKCEMTLFKEIFAQLLKIYI